MSDKKSATSESPRDPDQIREEIEETRAELGETVAAVAERTDVKHRAQTKASELREQATGKARELGGKAKTAAPDSAGEGARQAKELARRNPVPLALAGTFLAGFVLAKLTTR